MYNKIMKKVLPFLFTCLALTGCTVKITGEDLPGGFSDDYQSRDVTYQENTPFDDTNALCTLSVNNVEDNLDYIPSESLSNILSNITVTANGCTVSSIDSSSRYLSYENNGLKVGNAAYKYGGLLKINFSSNFTKVKIKCHARCSYVFHETTTERKIESQTSLNVNGSDYILLKNTYEENEELFYYTYFTTTSSNTLSINTDKGSVIIKEIILY